jgi:ABC-type nickel/cobalt efflux system permease component RcnA
MWYDHHSYTNEAKEIFAKSLISFGMKIYSSLVVFIMSLVFGSMVNVENQKHFLEINTMMVIMVCVGFVMIAELSRTNGFKILNKIHNKSLERNI